MLPDIKTKYFLDQKSLDQRDFLRCMHVALIANLHKVLSAYKFVKLTLLNFLQALSNLSDKLTLKF